MFRKQKVNTLKLLTINVNTQGFFSFTEPVHLVITSHFEGEIKAKGQLVIDKNASFKGHLEGTNIIIKGQFKGTLKASNSLKLTRTANVLGEISSPKMQMDEGATHKGSCNITEPSKITQQALTPQEVAQYLDIEFSEIEQWLNQNLLPATKHGDNYVIYKSDLEAWLLTSQKANTKILQYN